MSYTPKFQVVHDNLLEMIEGKKSTDYLRGYFREACLELGPYERINNLYRIRVKRPGKNDLGRLQFFRMNAMQEKFWSERTTRDLIVKMRQGGVTTLSCLVAIDKALWETDVNCAIMAHVKENVQKYFRITKNAFKCFQGDWGNFHPVTNKIDNVTELFIEETGSSLSVSVETKGLTLDFLHIAEAAFTPDSRISESIESVPLSSWIIMETTPDTASGFFYKLWYTAVKKKEDGMYKAHFYPWWFQYPEEEDIHLLKVAKGFAPNEKENRLMKEHGLKDYQIVWRRKMVDGSGGDEAEFLRKYPEDPITCFLSGSSTYFEASTLESLWNHQRDPAFTGDLDIVV